jgi:hypothetical protein
MKIKTITSRHRNDYTAIMECEHCGHEQIDNYGYFDANYMENVIPRMYCQGCEKDRAGVSKTAKELT